MNKAILLIKVPGNKLEAKIQAIPGWDGFDNILDFLLQEYAMEVLNNFEGPDARRCILKKEKWELELLHDDMFGNYLVASNEESEQFLYEICNDLEERLRN